MPEFDAILFDFDGVLIDSEPVHCACWAQVLAPEGVALDWELYSAHCIGIDDRDMLRMLAARSSPPRDWQTLWALYPAKKELFRARMVAAPPFPPLIAALLDELHGRYRMAVVSSSSSAEIEPLLAAAGLKQYFDALVGGDHVHHHKPDPEPYRAAAARLEARRPLVVEDSEAGIASGRAAGFEVLAVKSPAEVPDAVRGRLLQSGCGMRQHAL